MAIVGGRGLKFKVDIDQGSLKHVLRNTKSYEHEKRKAVGKAIDEASNIMVADMKAHIPVDTGLAKRSTRRRLFRMGKDIIDAEVRTRVPYAVFIERRTGYFARAIEKGIRHFLRLTKRMDG